MNKKYGAGVSVKKEYTESFKWIKHNTEIEVGRGSLFTITYTDLAKSKELISKSKREKNDELKKGTKETSDAI
ncbi:MAG: hypothetical protein WC615_18520 [Mucilaginibacter sp.]|jgi:hypothetical protein|uniref:hypothetical protein n=1 Tax=Mucilaginibacter sp. TaxID=1882438 RepID=UPI00356B4CB7